MFRPCNVCLPFLPAADPPQEAIPRDDMGEISAPPTEPSPAALGSPHQVDDRTRSDHFDAVFPDDIFYSGEKLEMLQQLVRKFRGVQNHIGYGNFNLIGMDEFFSYAAQASSLGPLSPSEKQFLEELFSFDAKLYGFNGAKVFTNFTDTIKKSEALKIPATGHYLRKGDSLEIYNKLRKDVGTSLVLTSGFRAVAKQFHLFLEKAVDSSGNLSKASRSLAPPGYSFHGRGDFDVGKTGYGVKNFTQDFATTDEYKRLIDLGYAQIRYTQSNLLGVRFEPWHIQVTG